MPHGHLTPLGRQLRSVLANLSCRSNASATPLAVHTIRQLHHSSASRAHTAAAATTHPSLELGHDAERNEEPRKDGRRFRKHSWRRLKRCQRVDHLTEALRDTGKLAAVPKQFPRKLDLSYVNPRSQNLIQELKKRHKRHQSDPKLDPAHSRELSLQRILASYIRHQSKANEYLEAEWESQFTLSSVEADFLHFKGFGLEDVSALADIVSNENILAAARALAQRAETDGPESVPTFIYLHLLRRQNVTAKALRILIHCVSDHFGHRAHRLRDLGVDNQPVFLVIVRLLRHAREVWPQAIPCIAEFWLRHLRYQEELHHSFESAKLSAVTYSMNKLMTLISYATAVNPFKDSHYQEAAIVPVLRYMSEHQPPMQINREGYRAVIRIQLTQRKSDSEQQWAELKALSWPPWKSDRTAMDATVDLEYGVTRAGATIARMQEAGYRPLEWEKTAQVYAGWDVDKTPTIQMRALLQAPGRLFGTIRSHDYTPWAARIASTRTVQEAWACYLAWEDRDFPHDQGVYLAIFQKLSAEDRRQRTGKQRMSNVGKRPGWSLLPGDTREVSPLPPSTHQYTYTRTLPPSLDEFYNSLIKKGVVLEDHCLAYLVRHANTLQSGLQRLRNSCQRYPCIRSLLTLEPSEKHSQLPLSVLTALVGLYARFAKVPMSKTAPEYRVRALNIDSQKPTLDNRLNVNNPMACAILILKANPVPHPPVWNAVLHGLTHEGNSLALQNLLTARSHAQDEKHALSRELQRCAGDIKAYRVLRRVVSLLRDQHLDLDAIGFHNLCLSTENLAVAGWSVILRTMDSHGEVSAEDAKYDKDSSAVQLRWSAKALLRGTNVISRLKGELRILIGQDKLDDAKPSTTRPRQPRKLLTAGQKPSSVGLPRLLVVPGPATLHAYIRALGWLADYDGLFDTVLWMREHEAELAERRAQNRSGRDMMRKAIVALRVFLQRSWLDDILNEGNREQEGEAGSSELGSRGQAILKRLQTPAGRDLTANVKKVVDEVEEWEGWASDEEVEDYAADKRFQRVKV